MPVNLDRVFPISRTYAVQAQITVFHDNEMCADAIDMDNEEVEQERARVNEERRKRVETQEEDTDVPPVVNLSEFFEIFNASDLRVSGNEPHPNDAAPDKCQAFIHIQNPPTYYVSLEESTEWRVVDLAEVLRREAKARVDSQRDEVFSLAGGVNEPRIDVDRVKHIIPVGFSKILYNTTPDSPQATWVELDTLVDHAALLKELKEKRAKVESLEETNMQLRAALDTQVAPISRPSPEELAATQGDALNV